MKIILVFLIFWFVAVCGDIMDMHSKLFGECLMMLEKNVRDGTIKFNVTTFLSAEELCDEFAAHIVSWTN
jgi:hypothetical protein